MVCDMAYVKSSARMRPNVWPVHPTSLSLGKIYLSKFHEVQQLLDDWQLKHFIEMRDQSLSSLVFNLGECEIAYQPFEAFFDQMLNLYLTNISDSTTIEPRNNEAVLLPDLQPQGMKKRMTWVRGAKRATESEKKRKTSERMSRRIALIGWRIKGENRRGDRV